MSKASKRKRNEAYKAAAPEPVGVDAGDPKPIAVRDLDIAFPASVRHLMPSYEQIPEDFRRDRSPWCRVVGTWFFKGLDASTLVPKSGIDKTNALRHLKTIMGSFEPKHEHKTASVAYLMSRWFEPLATQDKSIADKEGA